MTAPVPNPPMVDGISLAGWFMLFVLAVVVVLTVWAIGEDIAKHRRASRTLKHALRAADRRTTPPAFVCPDCRARSWHSDDGRYGWCGRCRKFTGRPADIDTDWRRPA